MAVVREIVGCFISSVGGGSAFPAFFRVAALKPDSLVSQFALYSLSDEFRMQPSGGYSPQQRQAIRDFLDYIETRVDEFDQEYVAKAKTLWQTVA
jgi:hypothetical protein